MSADYYGGSGNPYEAIKVINAWGLGFNLGNVAKYVARAGKKSPEALSDLLKARDYLDYEIARLDNSKPRETPSRPVDKVLDVGARVRVRAPGDPLDGCEGTIKRKSVTQEYEWAVDLDLKRGLRCFNADELEPLTPTPDTEATWADVQEAIRRAS